MSTPYVEPQDRFWPKVDKSGDCWLWTSTTHASGYGMFWLAGKYEYAHRVAYTWAFGAVPDGQMVDHACFVHNCVNPAHLRPVTNKQNQENRSGGQRNNRSGVQGVSWNRARSKWQAHISHNGKRTHLGLFSHIEDAARVVTTARNEMFTHNTLDRVSV